VRPIRSPLHSSRADVERLLGAPNSSGKYTSTYNLAEEIVTLIYAAGGRCGNDVTNSWKVPEGRIVDISVSLKKKLPFSALSIQQNDFRKTENPRVKGLFYYTNEKEGVRYTIQTTSETPEGFVMNVNYWPAAEDYFLRCATQGEESKRDRVPFEDYGRIPFNDEKPRLDNFAIQLQHDPALKGYIVVYARCCARQDEAKRRARRAKKYLVNVRGIAPTRVMTMDGGCRETLTTGLYLLHRDLPPPAAKPILDGSEVRTIKIRRSKKNTLP
jgi:hypothetical protein